MNEKLNLRADALEWREIDGEIVALATRSSTYIAINSSGAALWPALARGATRGELVSVLQDRFAIDGERAGKDVDSFLAAMRGQDLLRAGSDRA
jgi:hypothetical protein